MSVDLNKFVPITEINKLEMYDYLVDTLEFLSDPNFDNFNKSRNRIFGTDDDVNEVITMFGRFAATIKNCTIIPK